jgi:hypothetical protein
VSRLCLAKQMSNVSTHFTTIFNSGIVNSDNEQYIHIRSDGRHPKPNEFRIADDELYVSKTSSDGITWVKYSG